MRFFFGGYPALRFLAIYGLGVLFAYSIVPYKTPWCIISIAWPFLFFGAALIEFVGKRFNRTRRGDCQRAAVRPCSLERVQLEHAQDTTIQKSGMCMSRPFVAIIRSSIQFWKKAPEIPEAKREMSGLVLLSSYFPIPWILGEFPEYRVLQCER